MGSDRGRPPTRLAEPREASRLTAWTRPSDPDAVHYIADDREGSGVLRNLSTTGALVEDVSRKVCAGVAVDLYFLFGRGRKRRIHAIGKVVRETETGFAVRFSRIENELERLVLSARPKPAFAEAPGEVDQEPVIDLVDVATPAAPAFPETVLRTRYERLRGLDPGQQVEDCIKYIANPEILVFEFLESFAAIETVSAQHEFSLRPPPADGGEVVLGHFNEGLEVAVDGLDGYAFQCLASNLSPLGRSSGYEDDPSGLDYLGLVQGPQGGLVLGVVPWLLEFTPYSLFMRALNCLAELAPSSQIERLSRDFLGGALQGPPTFDLHVIVPHGLELEEVVTLAQLTRDLAEKLATLLREAPQFPDVLRHVLCVRLEESAFQGRVELDWRVG